MSTEKQTPHGAGSDYPFPAPPTCKWYTMGWVCVAVAGIILVVWTWIYSYRGTGVPWIWPHNHPDLEERILTLEAIFKTKLSIEEVLNDRAPRPAHTRQR